MNRNRCFSHMKKATEATDQRDEELPLTRDPSALILRIGDSLGSHADEIERVYKVYSTSIFIVGVLAVIVTLLILATWSFWNLGTQAVFLGFDAILIGFVVYALRAQKGFDLVGSIEWEVDRFRFVTTLELLPPKGLSPSERFWNSLKEASRSGEELKEIPPDRIKFDAEVTGKSGKTYTLAVFVHEEPRNRILRFLSKWTLRGTLHWAYYWFFPRLHDKLHEKLLTVLVKRVNKEAPVSKSDLEELKKEFEDISKKLRDVPEHAIVVSASGFSQDALEYAKDERGEVRPFADEEESCPMEIVVERSDGSYEVAHYG